MKYKRYYLAGTVLSSGLIAHTLGFSIKDVAFYVICLGIGIVVGFIW